MTNEKLKLKGLWLDDKKRVILVNQENQYGYIGYIITSYKDNEATHWIKSTKVMYDFNGVNKMDQTKLMERLREGSANYPHFHLKELK